MNSMRIETVPRNVEAWLTATQWAILGKGELGFESHVSSAEELKHNRLQARRSARGRYLVVPYM